VEIEIWADVVCPWCYMGKIRLEKALASYAGLVTVRYRPFQLDPRPVDVSTPLVDAMARRFGGSERVRQMFAHTAEVAAGDGLTLNFDRAVAANTLDAHRLVWFAGEHGRGSEMLDAIYRAHFTDGVDLGSRPALAELAAGVGLDGAAGFLADDDAGTAEVHASLAEARELGITGVPMFVFAGKYAVSGAQPPETLRSVLDEVERREADVSRPVPR
jgi:predicted DsbA family dithiol-disulfide isomerase